MLVPKLSTIMIEGDIAAARAKAEKLGEPPREAWLLECVQEDRNNPLPCTDEDERKWGKRVDVGSEGKPNPTGAPGSSAEPQEPGAPRAPHEDEGDQELLKEILGGSEENGAAPAGSGAKPADAAPSTGEGSKDEGSKDDSLNDQKPKDEAPTDEAPVKENQPVKLNRPKRIRK
jgi:hypothetical protein